MTPDLTHTRDLVDRLFRLSAAGDWAEALNPTQRMALAYLARATGFRGVHLMWQSIWR